MNSEGKYKDWKDKHEGQAFKNYQGFQDAQKNRVILFESAADLITCFKANVKDYGGSGIWENIEYIRTDETQIDPWRFGEDFPTIGKTNKALKEGAAAQKYINMVDMKRHELFHDIPRLQELEEIRITKRRRFIFAEEGDEIDISRYLDEDERFWRSMPRQEVKGKIARLYMNFGVSSGVDTQTITDNVITMAAIADIIQAAGVFVEIYASCAAKNPTSGTKWFNVTCKAKSAEEPLDIARLLTFALPGFFRNYVFGTWSNIIGENETVSSGLGKPPLSSEDLLAASEFFEADIKINGQSQFKEKKDLNLIIGDIEKFFKLETPE